MKLLLLAGTREAGLLAARLAGDARFEVVASLAGVTRDPAGYPVSVRVGGFGGEDGLRKFLLNNAIDAVVDATHPFARTMPHRVQTVCAGLGLACLRLERPGWRPEAGDDWHYVNQAADASDVIAPGARVFVATGPRSLPEFAALAEGRHLVARAIDRPSEPFPFREGKWVVGRPPITLDDEIRLFRDMRIDALVAKDSGGPTDAKLAAARALGIGVVLLKRPPRPPGDRVETVGAALDWLERRA